MEKIIFSENKIQPLSTQHLKQLKTNALRIKSIDKYHCCTCLDNHQSIICVKVKD